MILFVTHGLVGYARVRFRPSHFCVLAGQMNELGLFGSGRRTKLAGQTCLCLRRLDAVSSVLQCSELTYRSGQAGTHGPGRQEQSIVHLVRRRDDGPVACPHRLMRGNKWREKWGRTKIKTEESHAQLLTVSYAYSYIYSIDRRQAIYRYFLFVRNRNTPFTKHTQTIVVQ